MKEGNMRDFHLRFYKNRWPDGIQDLLKNNLDDFLYEKPGAYVLGTSDGTMLTYPWGKSPVYYIGKTESLWDRLAEHKKWIKKAIEDHEEDKWEPRYQYGAAFGTTFAWYTIRGTQDSGVLEAELINRFYEMFGSTPVANGSWPSGIKPLHGSRDG